MAGGKHNHVLRFKALVIWTHSQATEVFFPSTGAHLNGQIMLTESPPRI